MARLTATNRFKAQNKNLISLNGTTSFIVAPVSYIIPQSFSIAFWYKPQQIDVNDRVVDQQNSGPQNGFTLNHTTANSPQLQFAIRNGASTTAAITSTNIKRAEWNFIVATFTTNSAKFFVNNIQQGSTDTSCAMGVPTARFTIGKRSGGSNFTQCNIGTFMVFSKVLSTTEMTNLYYDLQTPINIDNCDIWYKFDEVSGDAVDSSGNSNTGTATAITYSIESGVRLTASGRTSSLPQNYQISAGTLLENFETLGDWTLGGTAGGSQSVDVGIFQEGLGSLELISNGASSNVFSTKTISSDLSNSGIISIDAYVSNITNTTSITIYLSSTSNFSKYFSRGITGIKQGWNRIRIYKNFWSNTGGEDWANTMIRLRVRTDSTANGGSIVYFDNLVYGTYHRPKIIWTCDDGWDSQYDELYTYAQPKGIKTTHYIVGSYIDTGNYLTTTMLNTMYANGMDICNHTYNHTNLTTLSTQVEMETEISLNKSFLTSLGFTRNGMLQHFCYPNGGYNDTALAALTNQGIKTARTIVSQSGISVPTPEPNPLLLVTRNLGNTTTLASAKSDVDNAIASGCTLVIESHKFVASPTTTTEWAISDMQALIDYIYLKSLGNQLDVVTISEWYNGLTNPRKQV